jgi:hypothetical protein
MVLPVLGLLGLGAAGLFGSAGKAIAGGAGEQMSDLYAQDRAEKLDYFKRKRLMEESAKISRQDQKLADKEANEKARQQLENTVKKQIGTLMQNGYSRQNASMIVANGNDSYTTALNFAGNLKPVDGVLPDPDTFYTTYTGDVALSGKDQEKINAISKGEWTEMAVNALDKSYTGAGVSPYRIVMTKKPTDKDKAKNISTSSILGSLSNSLITAKSRGVTDEYYMSLHGLDNPIQLKFKPNGDPEDEATKTVIDNLNNSIQEIRKISGTQNKGKDYSKDNVPRDVVQQAYDLQLQQLVKDLDIGTSPTSQFAGFAGTFDFKENTNNDVLKALSATYTVYDNVETIYFGKGLPDGKPLPMTQAPNFKLKRLQFQDQIKRLSSNYVARDIDADLIKQENTIIFDAGNTATTKQQLAEYVKDKDFKDGTIIKSKEGISVAIILSGGFVLDLIP